MLQLIIFGLLLGWGAAIPIGAINLEMIRRNLRFGTHAGLGLGIGACSADLTYLVLLSLGAFTILNYPGVLKATGIIGSLILGWFGYCALRLKATVHEEGKESNPPLKSPAFKHLYQGYLLTLVNPTTILFWSSVSVAIATRTQGSSHATFYAGIGVLLGTISWTCGLNFLLHLTRHRLSHRTMQNINVTGGIILLGFAILGLWHAFSS